MLYVALRNMSLNKPGQTRTSLHISPENAGQGIQAGLRTDSTD